jgi:acetyl esterase/lipase
MKKVLFLFFIFLSFSAAQNFTLPLWIDAIPNYQHTDEMEIRDTTDIVKISYVQQPAIDVYLPAKKNATGQAVIICPGGGYWILAYDWEGSDIAKWLNSKGVAAIVLKYRLPVSKSNIIRHESPLLDAKRAMRLVRFHAQTWQIKPDKIGIMGFSAGGHLASTLGTHFDPGDSTAQDPIEALSSRPDFMILVYPVITFCQPFMHRGSRNSLLGEAADTVMVTYFSNELQVKENTPPTFLVHAGDDDGVPVENSLVFYQALRAKKIPAEMHIYPEGGHGFSLAIGKYYLDTWTDRCIDWLQRLNLQ